MSDRRLAAVVRRCQDLPGYELFQYLDEDGQRQAIDSADVNDYLREIAGEEFTAKDFRTWGGTVLAAFALAGPGEEGGDARRRLTAAIGRRWRRGSGTPPRSAGSATSTPTWWPRTSTAPSRGACGGAPAAA